MIRSCLEIAEKFLPVKFEHLDSKIVMNKAKKLDVVFPEAMVQFYEFYGNNPDFLSAFFIFRKLDEIEIKDSRLVFASSRIKENVFGIPLERLSNGDDPNVQSYSHKENKWYSECFSCSRFFANMACSQMVNMLPNIEYIVIKEKILSQVIGDRLNLISDNKRIFSGFRFISYYNIEFKVLASYSVYESVLLLSSSENINLQEFKKKLHLELVSPKNIKIYDTQKVQEKATKLDKTDKIVKSQYHVNLSQNEKDEVKSFLKYSLDSDACNRAIVLVKALDESEGRKVLTLTQIANDWQITPSTVSSIRKKYCTGGLEAVLGKTFQRSK